MNIICNAIFMLTLSLVVIREYTILQHCHYELSKYLIYIKNNRKKYYYFLYFLLGVFVINMRFLYMILSLFILIYLIRDYKLKYTFRIKRLLWINFTLLTVLLVFDLLKYVFIVPFLYLLLVHFFSLCIEKVIYFKYLKKAKEKIKDKYVIGITGSCGKTSVKNIIYDLMINERNVSKTPKSYNNRMGILRSINENVSFCDEYFICEYGVDKVGGMDKLVNIVKPNIAIITEIGNQHLLSFKSVENICKEKIKLIENLKYGGIGIINNDNPYLSSYNYRNKTIFSYGIKNNSDVMAKNIKLTSQYSEFDLYIKNKFIKRVKTRLLSIHGVENLLCGICTCLCLKIDIEKILINIKNVSAIEHRLEIKKIDNVEVIDDSFNSNIKGFNDALDILRLSSKYKVIITPGIIEQGSNNKNVSIDIAKKMMEICDYVYLVSDNVLYIKEYFDECYFKKYSMVDSFNDAFNAVKKIEEDKIILIENDLPNIYLK